MDATLSSDLADAVLAVHALIVAFNVFGLVAIPLGAWRKWAFVRIAWWRVLHLVLLAIVALQALLDRACFLTIWQDDLLRLAGETPASGPWLRRLIMQVIFWPLPLWVFAVLYVAVWIYTLSLWWLVPPRTA